ATVGAGLDAVAAAAAGVGLDVKVSARRTGGDGPVATIHVGGGATPVEADARTLLPEAAQTVLAAETPAKPAGTRTMVYGAAAAVLLVAAVGIGVTLKPPAPAKVATNAVVTTAAAAAASATATAAEVAPDAPKPPAVTPILPAGSS